MKILALRALTLLAFTTVKKSPWFSGRIIYHNEFQNAAGETLTSNLGPESWCYYQGNSYKIYTGDKKMRELYVGKTRTLLAFIDGKTTPYADTARHHEELLIRQLPTTATILGYRCHAVRLTRGSRSSIVFFAAELRVNPRGFSNYPAGYWHALLTATKGALPLRNITIDSEKGYTMTLEATSVQPMLLDDRDFMAAAPAE